MALRCRRLAGEAVSRGRGGAVSAVLRGERQILCRRAPGVRLAGQGVRGSAGRGSGTAPASDGHLLGENYFARPCPVLVSFGFCFPEAVNNGGQKCYFWCEICLLSSLC